MLPPSETTNNPKSRLLVFSSLFPSDASPTSGTFIRERMFRVGKHVPIVVVAPQAWSPFDPLVRLIRKSFRPISKEFEVLDGIEIYRPKALSIPAFFKEFDGRFMAWGSRKIVDKIVDKFEPTIIDAHFAYPDGYAASYHAKRHKLPLTITLRGSKDEWLIGTPREHMLKEALTAATQLISVSDSLKIDVAQKTIGNSVPCEVIGNGVDLLKFTQVNREQARKKLGLTDTQKVIIGVGSLIDRKGFHRVIPIIQKLKSEWPDVVYLIVGGGATHGDMTATLKRLISEHDLLDNVRFCGSQLPQDLKWFYGAADVFALATEHEGWANVFLEAMACGLPVISTLVGGNKQVVCEDELGILTPFWDANQFETALRQGLRKNWDRNQIMNYAQSNSWSSRVTRLVALFESITKRSKSEN